MLHELQPHQQRVVEEKLALDTKVKALETFLSAPLFDSLDVAERGRLRRQLQIMQEYSSVLGERIAHFV